MFLQIQEQKIERKEKKKNLDFSQRMVLKRSNFAQFPKASYREELKTIISLIIVR